MHTNLISLILIKLLKSSMPIIPQSISNTLPIRTHSSSSNRQPSQIKGFHLILCLNIPEIHFTLTPSSKHEIFISAIKTHSIHRMHNLFPILFFLMAFKSHHRIRIPSDSPRLLSKVRHISSPINRSHPKHILISISSYTRSINLRPRT